MATNRTHLPHPGSDEGISGHAATLEFSNIDLDRGLAVFKIKPLDQSTPPEILVPLSQIGPNTIEDRDELWSSLTSAVLERFKDRNGLPLFVKGYDVRKGEDSTGDPALYVQILVNRTEGPADKGTASRWAEFSSRFQDALLQLRLQRWPYVSLRERGSRK